MTKPERKQHILERLRSNLAAIQDDPRFDWERTSEEIYSAADTMMKAVQQFIDGKLDEVEIKPLYKAYVSLHDKAEKQAI